jgi:hypothetical protein
MVAAMAASTAAMADRMGGYRRKSWLREIFD